SGGGVWRLSGAPQPPARRHHPDAITHGEIIRKILQHLKLSADPPPIAPARVRQEAFAWSSAGPCLVRHRSVSYRCHGEGPRRRLLLHLTSPHPLAVCGGPGRPPSASPH